MRTDDEERHEKPAPDDVASPDNCLRRIFGVRAINAADKNPYRIGFVGSLTGRISDLGIQGRNAVMLAVEEINQDGGIQWRPLHQDDGCFRVLLAGM